MEKEDIAKLEAPIRSAAKGRGIILALQDLTLATQDAINFLERREAGHHAQELPSVHP